MRNRVNAVLVAAIGLHLVVMKTFPASAKDDTKPIGSWFVMHSIDSMDDSIKDAALTPDGEDRYALVLRCFGKAPEAFIFVGKAGDKFEDKGGYSVKFRADQGTPVDMSGAAQSNGTLDISRPTDVIAAAYKGNKLAFRILGQNDSFSSDIIFKPTRSREALSEIVKNCSINTSGG